MDGIDYKGWIIEKLDLPQTEPLTLNFEALGYENAIFLLNMGSLIIVYLVFPPYVITLCILSRFKNAKISGKANELLDQIFFNSVLSFLEETYLITTVCCFINILYVIETSEYLELHSVMAYAALCIVVTYPLVVLGLYLTPKDKL